MTAARVYELGQEILTVLDGTLHAPDVRAGLSTEEAAAAGCRPCQAMLALRELEQIALGEVDA